MTVPVSPALAMPPAPRQFALVLDEADPEYAECVAQVGFTDPIVWWGVHTGDDVLLYRFRPDGKLDTAHHADPERALDVWDRLYPIKLVWL